MPRRPTIRLHARCLVLDDGRTRIAIVVVDSCVLDRPIHRRGQALGREADRIPASRIFISDHALPLGPGRRSAPWAQSRTSVTAISCPARSPRASEGPEEPGPAQVGWAVGGCPACRKAVAGLPVPDKIQDDPFGQKTTRATMHPGYRNPDWEEPSGPMNPDVPVIAVRRPGGAPIALLSNFSIHYVGAPGAVGRLLRGVRPADRRAHRGRRDDPPFVGMLSNGVSGDAYLNDYSRKGPEKFDMNSIAETVAQGGGRGLPADCVERLAAPGRRRTGTRAGRTAAEVRLGQTIMDQIQKEGRPLKSLTDFYAREQLALGPDASHAQAEASGGADRRTGDGGHPLRGVCHHGPADHEPPARWTTRSP